MLTDQLIVPNAKRRIIKAKNKMNTLLRRFGKAVPEEEASHTVSEKSDDEGEDYGHVDDDSLGNADEKEDGGASD